MAVRQRHLFDGLQLLLHRCMPRWITLSLGVGCWLPNVRQMQLSEEALRLAWWSLIANDIGHRAIAERLIIVVGV